MRYAACSEDHSTCLSTACEAFSAQAFSKNCLDIFIAKSCGTRHLQGLTNLKSRAEEEIHKEEALHVANTLIITLSLHVCSSCFQASVYKKQSTRRRRLYSGPEPGTYGGKLRIWYYICVCCIRAVFVVWVWTVSFLDPCPALPHEVMAFVCVCVCDTSTAAILSPWFLCFQKVQIKDQGSDIPTHAFSKNCLDIFIAKSGGTRHLQGLTARSGNSFNSNLKSRGRNSHRAVTTRGKHTNDHTDFACLLQLLPRMRLQENMSEGSAVTSLWTRQVVLAQLLLLILVKNGVMLFVLGEIRLWRFCSWSRMLLRICMLCFCRADVLNLLLRGGVKTVSSCATGSQKLPEGVVDVECSIILSGCNGLSFSDFIIMPFAKMSFFPATASPFPARAFTKTSTFSIDPALKWGTSGTSNLP